MADGANNEGMSEVPLNADYRDADWPDGLARDRWEGHGLDHAIVENISSALLVLDDAFRIVMCNRGFRNLFHIADIPLTQRTLDEALGCDALEGVIRQAAGSGRHVREIEFSHRTESGEERQFLISVSHIRDESTVGRVLVTLDEVTEWKRRQSQVMEASRLVSIGEMVAGAAHEINNPLAAVMGFSQLVLRRYLDAETRSDVERILTEATRASRVVSNLQSFARGGEPSKAPVDLVDIVERVLELKSYELRVDNINIVTEFEMDSAIVLGNPQQLEQVVLNITSNAAHFMKEANDGGTLKVDLSRQNGTVRLVFTDDGPGIGPAHLPKVFDPFFTTKDVGSGTGLGLSICYGIIKEHGGTITVESAPGEGATFIIELEAQKVAEIDDLPTVGPVQGPSQKVLIVDDEPAVVDLIGRVLKEFGFTVETASSGTEVIDEMDVEEFDIIILDFRMPRLGGAQLFEYLESVSTDIAARVMFITGDTDSANSSKVVERSGNPVLRKPFTLEDLIAAVVSVADRRTRLESN